MKDSSYSNEFMIWMERQCYSLFCRYYRNQKKVTSRVPRSFGATSFESEKEPFRNLTEQPTRVGKSQQKSVQIWHKKSVLELGTKHSVQGFKIMACVPFFVAHGFPRNNPRRGGHS